MRIFKPFRFLRARPSQGEFRLSDVKATAKTAECARCNPTARAIAYVQCLWVVSGIDRE